MLPPYQNNIGYYNQYLKVQEDWETNHGKQRDREMLLGLLGSKNDMEQVKFHIYQLTKILSPKNL